MHLAKKAILLLPLIPAAVCLPLGTSAHSKSINVARSEGSGWALPIAPHIASRDVAVKDDGKEGGEVKADNPAAPSESKTDKKGKKGDKKEKKGDKKDKKGDKKDKSGTAADKKQEKDEKKKQAVDKKQKADDEKKHEADVEKTEKAEKKVKDAEGKKKKSKESKGKKGKDSEGKEKKSKESKGKKGKDSEGKETEAPEGKEEQKRAVLIDLPEDGIESEDGAMPDPKSGPHQERPEAAAQGRHAVDQEDLQGQEV
ncbi:hypothetical protein MAPG_04584 [Magnaporthiopsis poae ATCC 64411]|uniref:Cylicin-2 n=1 Tax=Magnaporthiopsis poae (strain ATCC 64411 / 73-15) TaxID=644358 RepID=A0A0C4DX46_MAGP6|nr:hypothetical protein MAPG_04584 [Magnaporthiopsis poae ATCC 64411]